MSFETLLKSLEEKAQGEESAFISTAKSEARRIKSEASVAAKHLIDEAKTEGQGLGNEQKLEINANAKLKQKRVLAEAREALIMNALEGVEPLLRDYAKSKQYTSLVVKLARQCQAALGKDCALRCRKQDEKTLKAHGFKITGNANVSGGVIGESSDGRVKVNNSLEALFEIHCERLKGFAYKELSPIFESNAITPQKKEKNDEKIKVNRKDKKNSKKGGGARS